jgi:hypothetical protein
MFKQIADQTTLAVIEAQNEQRAEDLRQTQIEVAKVRKTYGLQDVLQND